MRRLIAREVELVLGEADVPVEHHFHCAALGEDGIRPTSGQNADQSHRRTRGSADPRAHARMTGGATCNRADRSARGGRLSDGARIARLVAFAGYFALGLIERSFGLSVHAADAGAEIASHPIGQCQRIEPYVQFAAAFYASRLLDE